MTEEKLQHMIDIAFQLEKKSLENIEEAANAASAAEEKANLLTGRNRVQKRFGKVIVVQHPDYKWGVINTDGNIIVPFGKYGWIDGFDSGLARVRSHGHSGRVGNTIMIIKDLETCDVVKGEDNIQLFHDENKVLNPDKYAKWGIINERGDEVLPVEYDDVWNFFGKKRTSTKVVKNGVELEVYFQDLINS